MSCNESDSLICNKIITKKDSFRKKKNNVSNKKKKKNKVLEYIKTKLFINGKKNDTIKYSKVTYAYKEGQH